MECLVLGARRFDFKDDEGARVEGTTLYYVTLDNEDEENRRGEIPLQISAPVAVYHQLDKLPALYEVDFRQRPGRGGKPTLQATGVSYSGPPSFGATSPPAG